MWRSRNIIKENKKLLEDRYKVKEIGVFGSFVSGEQKSGSDVDILVDFYEVPDLFEFINLERYLQLILKKKVDLVTLTPHHVGDMSHQIPRDILSFAVQTLNRTATIVFSYSPYREYVCVFKKQS